MSHSNFFSFGPLQQDAAMVKTGIRLNSTHAVFSGHFPGNPILPGVCMLQIVKEVVESSLDTKVKLLKASELKFLAFVTPNDRKLLQLELKITTIDDHIRVEAKLRDIAEVLFKFKGMFTPK